MDILAWREQTLIAAIAQEGLSEKPYLFAYETHSKEHPEYTVIVLHHGVCERRT